MTVLKANVNFQNSFNGELIVPNGTVKIGTTENTLLPYDLLFGALASCLYSTFLDVAVKKKIDFESAQIVVEGEKRTEIPTTLKWVKTKIIIKSAQEEKGLIKAFELATKYCSIYQTISSVADMEWEVEFVN